MAFYAHPHVEEGVVRLILMYQGLFSCSKETMHLLGFY